MFHRRRLRGFGGGLGSGRVALVVVLTLMAGYFGATPAAASDVTDIANEGAGVIEFDFQSPPSTNWPINLSGRFPFMKPECILVGQIPDVFNAMASLYVIPHRTIRLGGNVELVKLDTNPNPILGSPFIEETVGWTGTEEGQFGPGDYDVVIDNCQNGYFDPDQDAHIGYKLEHGIITVRDTPKFEHSADTMNAFKRTADQNATIREAFKWMYGFFTAQLVGECMALYSEPGKMGLCFLEVRRAASLIAIVGAERHFFASAAYYAALHADPPDPDFRRVTVLESSVVDAVDGSDLVRRVQEIGGRQAADATLAAALLHAIERYQGAEDAGDADWALVHLRETADLTQALAVNSGSLAASLHDAAVEFRSDPDLPQTKADALVSVAELQRIQSSGFNSQERQAIANVGLSEDVVLSQLGEMIPEGFDWDGDYSAPAVAAGLTQMADRWSASGAELSQIAQGWTVAVSELEAQPSVPRDAPTLRINGPLTAVSGQATTLAAQVTPGDSTVEWDLDGDGAFDDVTGTSATGSWNTPGHGLVQARATAPNGRTAVTYATLTVNPVGGAPTVTTTPSPDTPVSVEVGQNGAFTASTTDPDGDPVSYTWRIDGAEAGNGSTLTYRPTSGDVGTHRVALTVTEDSADHAVQKLEWPVIVSDVDADADGWTRTTDCNDADPLMNPSAAEVLGNGKDDDCDAASSDVLVAGSPGTLLGWGRNTPGFGAVGDGTDLNRSVPVQVVGLNNVADVAAGGGRSVAVRDDGTVWKWGQVPEKVPDVDAATPAQGQLSGAVDVDMSSVAGENVLVLRTDGSIAVWGPNGNGQLGIGSTSSSLVTPVLVKAPDGTHPLTGAVSVAQGSSSTAAVLADGTVLGWGGEPALCPGRNPPYVNQLLPIPLTAVGAGVRQVAIGDQFSLFLKVDGSVLSCGNNVTGQLGRPSANDSTSPRQVTGLGPGAGIVQVAASQSYALALKDDGTVLAWGNNQDGELGNDTITGITFAPVPVLIPPGPPVVQVTAGVTHALAVRADGSVLAWGENTSGRTGLGTTSGITRLPKPVTLAPGVTVRTVTAGWQHSHALIGTAATSPPPPGINLAVGNASAPAVSAVEGTDLIFPISLSYPRPVATTVTWTAIAGTAGPSDIAQGSGTATIDAGQTTGSIHVPTSTDGIDEPDESLTVNVTQAPGTNIVDASQDGTIIDNDGPPAANISNATVTETDLGTVTAQVTVSLATASAKTVTVSYATAAGTATESEDYIPTSGTLIFAPGETEKPVPVRIRPDLLLEPAEALTVRVVATENATAGNAGTVTINDNEPYLATLTSPVVDESAGVATINIGLASPPLAGEQVALRLTTADGSATSGQDYTPVDTTVTLTAGTPTAAVAVPILNDTNREDPELLRVTVTGQQPVRRLLTEPATVRINDDDLADTTAPTVTGAADRGPNNNGWYNTPVTVTWTAIDDRDGPLPPPPAKLVGQGKDQTVTSANVCDQAGNCRTGTFGPLSVDTTAPSVTITGPTPGANYSSPAAVPPVGCTASDALSGLTEVCTVNTTARGNGSVDVEALATDKAGNVGRAQLTYTVTNPHSPYPWTSFLQPINDTAHDIGSEPDVSVFKAGSTIPVKFRLVDSNGAPVTPASAPRWMAPVKGVASSQPVDETVYSLPADSGQNFRWETDHWQYNWQTNKNQAGFYWRIGVALDDGTTHVVYIALK